MILPNLDLDNEIKDIVSKIVANSSQNFWLIRTESGSLYEDFRVSKSVGLNHFDFTLEELAKLRNAYTLKGGRQLNKKKLKQEISRLIKIKQEKALKKVHIKFGKDSSEYNKLVYDLSLRSSQIFKFVFEMKKGDYVVVPSESSALVMIGRITDSALLEPSRVNPVPLQKKVEWINTYEKTKLDINFIKVFMSHQAINNINKYRDIILRTVYDFYLDNDRGHLVLNVELAGEIPATDFYGFGYTFLETLQGYFDVNNLPYSSKDVKVVSNLNSPGKIKLFSSSKEAIICGAVLLSFIIGADLDIGFYEAKVKVKTPGFIKTISDYKNEKSKRDAIDVLKSKSDSMKIADPKDIIDILKQLD